LKKLSMLYRRRRVPFLICSGLMLAAVIAGITTAAIAFGTEPTPKVNLSPSCTPETNSERIREYERIMADFQEKTTGMTDEQKRAAIDELDRVLEEKGFIKKFSLKGMETRGSQILIAGQVVKLPADAELNGMISSINPVITDGQISSEAKSIVPSLPVLWITRGNSYVWIGLDSGVIVSGMISAGEEGAFDFLKEYFPAQARAIDALPIRDPETLKLEVTE